MAIEPKTGLDFWPPGAMQPDLLFNALLYWVAVWAQPVVIAIEDAPPGSPDEGDTYLVGTGSGAWTGHDDELAYWDGAVWQFFAPLEGYEVRNSDTGDVLVYESGAWGVAPGGLSDAPVDGSLYGRRDGDWEEVPDSFAAEDVSYDNSVSGLAATEVQAAIDEIAAAGASNNVTIITEASAFTIVPATHSGRHRYTRAGGDVTFDDGEALASGQVYNIRATGNIELLEDGVTLTPPAGGTLEMESGMMVAVVMTSGTTGDVSGQTVAAP